MRVNHKQLRKARIVLKYRNAKIRMTLDKLTTVYGMQAVSHLRRGIIKEGDLIIGTWPDRE